MDTFVLGITLFTMIVLTLVSIIIFARSKLVSSGDVNITINGENYYRHLQLKIFSYRQLVEVVELALNAVLRFTQAEELFCLLKRVI